MTKAKTMRAVVIAVGLALARTGAADVTGSYDGAVASTKLASPMSVSAVLSQTGKLVSGTVALPGDPSAFGGAYLVTGKATPKHVKLKGVAGPVKFKWSAKITGTTLAGKAHVTRPGQKLVGTLTLTLNVSTSDGSSCDGVYQANQTFFDDQVLGDALVSCRTCHAPGLQAAATRLHVLPADPLATARSVALMVDFANPTASRIIQKPEALLPHGGAQQIMPGSPQEQELMQWIDLLAQAHCN